ncbi:MAG: ribosomal protein L11 methyltransferase [Cyclobacteriaceae bacterium]
MSYFEVNITTADLAFREIMLAELGEIGFETFEETDSSLMAYIPKENFKQHVLEEVTSKYQGAFEFEVSIGSVEKENWNKQWEENYDPIVVDDRCIVRASFHKIDKKFPIEIIITPKMSFGTGHHATTWQMLKLQLDTDFSEKTVLDVGSGTGVLAIMAAKLGAKSIEASDIDDWCIENSLENFEHNDLPDVRMRKGEITNLNFDNPFDIILANINKNVLLNEISYYADLLVENGKLFLSGFYETDIKDIVVCAKKSNLSQVRYILKDNWAAMIFSKD